MSDPDDDPWGFLADKASRTRGVDPAPGSTGATAPDPRVGTDRAVDPESSPVVKRQRGELRAGAQAVPLKVRARPMALSLLLVSIAGFLTEIVASAQVLSLAGPNSMLIIYPLGGIGLLGLALAQFRYIDGRARLPTIRVVAAGYAIALAVCAVLLTGSVMPAIAAAVLWLLADQLNYLLPLMLWSLAGDEFNVAEGRKIFGWIVTWTYAGQVTGLVLASVGAPALAAVGVPLSWALVIPPILCAWVAWWLPRSMRDSAAARGLAHQEDLATSLRSAWDFVSGVPVWRNFLWASILTFIGGMVVFIVFLTGLDAAVAGNAEQLQLAFGSVGLISFLICWGIQKLAAQRVQDRLGIQGTLLILPVATILSAGVLALGLGTTSLAVMALGLAVWMIPRWSVDENARRAALALVPDERRTRVSFFVDLGPVAIGLIVSGPAAALGLLTGAYWLAALAAGLCAALALVPGVKVYRGWEDSLLSWRLRRRKRNRTLDLGDDL